MRNNIEELNAVWQQLAGRNFFTVEGAEWRER